MVRNILALIAGYILTAALTFAIAIVLALIFSEYREAMEEFMNDKTTDVRPPFLPVLMNLILGFPAAIIGGILCAAIARNRVCMVLILAGLTAVLGGVLASNEWNGFQPNWYLASLPVVGSIGVAIGGLWWAKRAGPAASFRVVDDGEG